MIEKSVKILVISIFIPILVFSSILSAQGYLPVIASRVSKINEIVVIPNPDYNVPNVTFYGIDVSVEILNRADENQTVVELSILDPKVFIGATFVNQSLEFGAIAIGFAQVKRYSYQSGITAENDYVVFYINQANMTQLPDGNYTLYRPIFWESPELSIVAGETLQTNITVTSGIVNITYANFNYQSTDNVTFSNISSLVFLSLCLYPIIRFRRRRKPRIV
ncbi:MAG: hypothetical protein KAU62_08650 [Candidatus Heimdallarchaeota archaeon]|nr:hypothetical protein [Candidatus Heimdallarchaeota archaeon]MCG3256137.1 hypothetical protein [Candidatus Heimdallarchaeota archaeon]MCK4611208.1 hypothetical protein [Candidatus Heimdallarchaeota archaeon]